MNEQPLLSWGDLHVYPQHVLTPTGQVPLADTEWFVSEYVERERFTPLWAVAAGCLLSPTIIGLGFLFARATRDHRLLSVEMHTTSTIQFRYLVASNSAAEIQNAVEQVGWLNDRAASLRANPTARVSGGGR